MHAFVFVIKYISYLCEIKLQHPYKIYGLNNLFKNINKTRSKSVIIGKYKFN